MKHAWEVEQVNGGTTKQRTSYFSILLEFLKMSTAQQYLINSMYSLQVTSVIFMGGFVLTGNPLHVAAMVTLTKSMCWRTVVKSEDINGIGVVIYQKPTSNSCYLERKTNEPHLCSKKDGSRFPWYVIACFISLIVVSPKFRLLVVL